MTQEEVKELLKNLDDKYEKMSASFIKVYYSVEDDISSARAELNNIIDKIHTLEPPQEHQDPLIPKPLLYGSFKEAVGCLDRREDEEVVMVREDKLGTEDSITYEVIMSASVGALVRLQRKIVFATNYEDLTRNWYVFNTEEYLKYLKSQED